MRAPVAPTGWPKEMPEPLGLSRSIEWVDLPLAQDGENLGGEGLVELDEVDLVEGEVSPVKGSCRRADGADAHDLRTAAGHRPRAQRKQRDETAFLRRRRGW